MALQRTMPGQPALPEEFILRLAEEEGQELRSLGTKAGGVMNIKIHD